MCERVPWKVQMLKKAFPNIPIFADVLHLHRGTAHDHVSGDRRKVSSTSGILAGYPCKSVSP